MADVPKWEPRVRVLQQQYIDRDPRQAVPVAPRVGPQAPPVTLRLVALYDVRNERIRAKLDRRPPQVWAA